MQMATINYTALQLKNFFFFNGTKVERTLLYRLFSTFQVICNMFVKFGYEICSNRTLCSEFHIKCEKNKLTDTRIHIICICALLEMFSFCGSFLFLFFYQPYLISFGKIHFAVSK